MKNLDHITLIGKNGRKSSLAIHGRRDAGFLVVVGGLEHSSEIKPDSQRDAEKLVKWLFEQFPGILDKMVDKMAGGFPMTKQERKDYGLDEIG